MKYFTRELLSASDDSSLTKVQRAAISRRFDRTCEAYRRQLSKLKPRISKQAWNFFCLGFGRWGLHDARLISFTVGDGLDYTIDGKRPFRVNTQRAKVRIQILNRHQNLFCTFTCNGIRKTAFNFVDIEPLSNKGRVENLDTYELSGVGKRHLCLEFLFTSGGTIMVEFERLRFERKRIPRKYATQAVYS